MTDAYDWINLNIQYKTIRIRLLSILILIFWFCQCWLTDKAVLYRGEKLEKWILPLNPFDIGWGFKENKLFIPVGGGFFLNKEFAELERVIQ